MPVPGAPINTGLPSITSTYQQVTTGAIVSNGSWNANNGGNIVYSYQWTRNGGAIGGATAQSYNMVDADDGATIGCVVTATNDYGATSATATGAFTCHEPPPSSVSVGFSGSSVVGSTLSASVSAAHMGGAAGSSWSYQWYRNGGAIGGATGSSYTLTDADDGQSISLSATASNDGGSASGSSGSTVPKEPAPTGGSASISGTAKVGSTLTASASGWAHMAGAGGQSYSYTWNRNGTAITTGTSYTLVAADDGTTVTVTVTATNDGGSATVTSSGAAVTYPAPTSTVAPAVTGTAATGQTLTCDGGSWSTTVTKAYQWQRDNTGGGVYSNISAATAPTYSPGSADVGCHLLCVVTASNDGGSASANSNATALVVAAPLNTAPPTITGTVKVGQTLTTSNGTWSYSPTSFAYFWQRDNQGDGNFGNIPGAASSTYTAVAADAGCQLRSVVVASNANGNGQASSAPTVRTTMAPVITAAPKVTDPNVFATGTATCDGGRWTGYPTVALSYQWQSSHDGATWTPIAGATSAQYVVPRSLIGYYVRCEVTGDNGVT